MITFCCGHAYERHGIAGCLDCDCKTKGSSPDYTGEVEKWKQVNHRVIAVMPSLHRPDHRLFVLRCDLCGEPFQIDWHTPSSRDEHHMRKECIENLFKRVRALEGAIMSTGGTV